MAIIGDLRPFFGEFAHLLRSIKETLCKSNSSTTQIVTAGTTGPIPAGFRSITITQTSANPNTVTITLPNATIYTLTELGQSFTNTASGNNTLPAYIIGGTGTFKWYAIK